MTDALFASDLDRTLIYSAGALALDCPDAEAPRLLGVETYRGAPLSYVTETAAGHLASLAASGGFVPVTTRTREQFARVRLPGPAPRYAVCANGGHLLVDGESDPAWHAAVRGRLGDCAPLAEVRSRMLRDAGPDWLLKERTAEDLFAYLVVDRARLPAGWLDAFTGWAGPRGWGVSMQGRKVYAVPSVLTKEAAVAEAVRRSGATLLHAAGDSLLDAGMLAAADTGWRPGHGELADTGWHVPHIEALPERGVRAGERIAAAAYEALRGGGGARMSAGAARALPVGRGEAAPGSTPW